MQAGRRFHILRRLGSGGMGVVFEAHDRVRGQRVALKTLRRTDPQSLYLFKREFRLLADLRHPSLVTLGELVHDGGRWFFTMELVEGTDFRTYCSVEGRSRSVVAETSTELTELPPSSRSQPDTAPVEDPPPVEPPRDRASAPRFDADRVRHALRGLCSGLAALHAAGKVHRDLKPANVLVSASGRVVLLDFGLVSELEDDGLTRGGGLREWGTPRYMAPEVLQGRAGPAADLYAVGVMLYDVLTGQPPFGGTGEPVLLAKTLREAIPPSAWAPNLPADLESLALRLLRRDPDERPTAGELLRELGVVQIAPRPVPLLCRSVELARLDDAFDEVVKRQQPAVVICEGAAGLGKTRLVSTWLEQLREVARARGRERAVEAGDQDGPPVPSEGAAQPPLVLTSVSYEDSAVPFQALDAAVDGLAETLAQEPSLLAALAPHVRVAAHLFPVLGRALPRREAPAADAPVDRGEAFGALAAIVHAVAASRSIVMFLDDAHWADADSSLLLTHLLEGSAGARATPLLVIAATRPRELGAPPRPLLAALAMVPVPRSTLLLRPLPAELPEDDARLVQEAMGHEHTADDAPSDVAAVSRLLAASGGHPLAFVELVRHRSTPSAVEIESGTFEDAVGRRLAELPASCRTLLSVVALSRSPLPLRVAGAAARSTAPEAERAHLVAAGLLRAGGVLGPDGVDVAHDRVRSVVLAALLDDTERQLHRSLAAAMRKHLPEQPDRIADHLLASGDAGAAEPFLLRAAEGARATLAYARAAELYRRAVRGRPAADPERSALLTCQGECEALAGHGLAAAEAFLAAAQVGVHDGLRGAPEVWLDPHVEQDLRRRAAEQLLVSGRQREGMRILRDVCRGVGLPAPVSATAAAPLFLAERAKLAIRGEKEARPTTPPRPEDRLRVNAARTAARALSIVDTMTAAYYQTLHFRLALDAGDTEHLLYAYGLSTGFSAAEEGSTGSRAALYLERNRALVAASRERLGEATLALSEAVMAYCHGDFPRCVGASERALLAYRVVGGDVVWDIGTARTFRLIALGMSGDLTTLAAEAADAQREADLRRDLYSTSFFQTGALPWVDLALGDPHFARQRLRRAVERHPFPGFSWGWFLSRIHLALIEVQADDPAAGHAALDSLRAPPVPLLVSRFRFHRLFALWARGVVSARALELRPRSPVERARLRLVVRWLRADGEPYARAWADSLEPALWLSQRSGARASYARAADRWEAVATTFERLGFSLFAASCFSRAGEAWTRAHETEGTATSRRDFLLAAAADRFQRAGVVADASLAGTLVPGMPRAEAARPHRR